MENTAVNAVTLISLIFIMIPIILVGIMVIMAIAITKRKPEKELPLPKKRSEAWLFINTLIDDMNSISFSNVLSVDTQLGIRTVSLKSDRPYILGDMWNDKYISFQETIYANAPSEYMPDPKINNLFTIVLKEDDILIKDGAKMTSEEIHNCLLELRELTNGILKIKEDKFKEAEKLVSLFEDKDEVMKEE